MTAGFFCRSDPAALLRGLANGGLALFDEAGVEVLEVGDPEEHLAAHLQHLRHREILCLGEPFGHVVDGARVERDVLADAPVAAGGRPFQASVAVHQSQRHPVDLELAQVVRIVADLVLDPFGPRHQLVGVEHVVETQHPLEVLGRGEVGGEAGAADQLSRRVGNTQLRVAVLQRDELVEQRVEFRVGDDRARP